MTIVLIAGKAGSGKDTVAKMLDQILTETYRKRVLITHFGDLVKYVATNFFDWDGIKDEDGRTLLQRIGTDVVRRYDPDYWVRFLSQMFYFFKDEFDYVLIPDFRFPNEYFFLEGYFKDEDVNIVTLKIERTFHSLLTREQQEHPSETMLDDFKFNVSFNNDKTYSELFESVQQKLAPFVLAQGRWIRAAEDFMECPKCGFRADTSDFRDTPSEAADNFVKNYRYCPVCGRENGHE